MIREIYDQWSPIQYSSKQKVLIGTADQNSFPCRYILNAKMRLMNRSSIHALLDIQVVKQRVSVLQTTRNCTIQALKTMGNLGLAWHRKLSIWIRLFVRIEKQSNNTNCTSDLISHHIQLQLLSTCISTMPHPVQKDSNLVDSASSIRLSQRLSHACLSINKSIRETANGSLYQL